MDAAFATSTPRVHIHEREGNGQEALLLHGIPGCAAAWDGVIARLPPGWHVFAPDLVGFGASERTDDIDLLHVEGQAAALERALAPRFAGRPVLVGHDFGGPVAIALLRRMPGRFSALVLAATNVRADTPIPLPLSLVNTPVVGRLAASVLFSRPSLRMMYRQGSRRRKLDPGPGVGDQRQARAIARIFGHSLRHMELYRPIEEQARQVDLPAAIVWGDADPFFSVAQGESSAALIPGASLSVLRNCGHFVPEEAPEEFAAIIADLGARAQGPTPPIVPG